MNLVITFLFKLNYSLIELNNEFGVDSYKFFGLKYCDDVAMFSLRSSQIGWIDFWHNKFIPGAFFLIICK